ncbi:acyl-CoA dehydrogenase family protein [Rhodococcus sp. DMU1]|uniref:acyl-CoA dehydrogenase family protein n=1 Tax=Rhodococcus sp. DMU1 TaxID=2722825 RepID=UPI00143ECA6B|nr:acyl-CoA dehydrogenase family protein [Rhodococcus sp. DMU1]QIX53552.1 acyl-CoA/acyl-ACP dehydrogenase [Rhodococcus sp. DMU1]
MTTTSTERPATDLLYSEQEEFLRETVRDVLNKGCDWTAVLALTESESSLDRTLWRTLAADVGGAALALPEDVGGAGASWRETAVLLEELGRSIAPVPYLGSAGVATVYAQQIGAADLLTKLAAGDMIAAVAVPAGAPWFRPLEPTVTVTDSTLTGAVATVADASAADTLLVPVGEDTYLVEVAAAGVRCTPVVSLDETRPLVDIEFNAAPGRRLESSRPAGAATAAALRAGAALLASEQLGLAEHCLAATVEYLGVRRQFGRVLGSYQALKHRLADLWVQINQARAAARYAAHCLATGSDDLDVAAAVAHSWCSEVAVHAAEEYVQLHGGIGFTWEHPAHLYLKRAKSSMLMFGGPDVHRTHLAGLIDLPFPTVENIR